MTQSRENFVRLAEARTNKILKDLDVLGNLSNKSNYTYSEEDVNKMIRAISKKVKDVEHRFRSNLIGKRDDEFRL